MAAATQFQSDRVREIDVVKLREQIMVRDPED
jgi:hypothetical protein